MKPLSQNPPWLQCLLKLSTSCHHALARLASLRHRAQPKRPPTPSRPRRRITTNFFEMP